jgi:hypothetical protein
MDDAVERREPRAMLRVKIWTASLAISGAIFYVLCLVGRFVMPDTGYHDTLLEVVLPGFEWLTPLGFIAGLVGSMVYGAVMGWVFSTVHNLMARVWQEA